MEFVQKNLTNVLINRMLFILFLDVQKEVKISSNQYSVRELFIRNCPPYK